MAAGEGNGVVPVEMEGANSNNNNNISSVISGWFSEISPMWPGILFFIIYMYPFINIFFLYLYFVGYSYNLIHHG